MATDDADGLDDARRQLYAQPPEQFVAARAALAAGVDDTDLATAIGALRKPTRPAWIVNAAVADNPSIIEELTDLGAGLAHAQRELDTARLRELTLGRRTAVARITAAALERADAAGAGTALREQVAATFDAAVADPDVAARLGALQRPESWSGFGVAPRAGLSLVADPPDRSEQSDRSERSRTGRRGATAPQRPDPPVDDGRLDAARAALDRAQSAEDEAAHREQAVRTTLHRLQTRLTTLQHDIATAREDLDAARTELTRARKARRSARAGVDRLQRERR